MTLRIITGDCRDELPRIPSGSIDCIITSPPYNIGKAYERRTSITDYEAWIRPVVEECARVVRVGGSVCWQVGNHVREGVVLPLDFVFYPMLLAAGLNLRGRFIWHFGHGLHATKRFSGRHETILWFSKGNVDRDVESMAFALCERFGEVWSITNVKHNHPEKTAHPCQFPEELVRRLMVITTKSGEVVLDPFAGSGTTGVVAAALGRRAILIERDAAYAEIAHSRIAQAAPLFQARERA